MDSSDHLTTATSARQCAAEMLQDILQRKRLSDEVFARHAAFATLSDRDRAFTRLLVLTTLRRLGQCDLLIANLLQRPLPEKSALVRNCLRLGIVQLLWLHTPPHAAVNSMVETAEALGFESLKGLVNAVLKQVATRGASLLSHHPEGATNLPPWLFAAWQETYGTEVAEAIASARLAEPPLDITPAKDAAMWAEKLGGALLPTGSIRVSSSGRIEALAGFDEGAWWVQDAAATLPVQMLSDVRGKTVLDLCAAPGGKTAQLAALGAHVLAIDNAPRRLQRLQENMTRVGLQIETEEADILRWKPAQEFDAIILDAPCSATGTLRRNPEVVWHKTQADCAELALLQRKMLSRAAKWLKVGGELVYCVCSLQREEGEAQITHFLEKHPHYQLTRPAHIPPEFLADTGTLRTHPALLVEAGGMDGFFAALLKRVS